MADRSKPNILFLMADQQQYATTRRDSPCLTPNLDRLGGEGLTFSAARTVNPICTPARASLFTGRLPHIHGMVDNTHCVEPFRADFQSELPTLSGHLREHGYRTGYFGKWHVERSANPGSLGFDCFTTEYHGRTFPRTLVESCSVSHDGYNDRTFYGVHSEDVSETEERFFYDRALDFVSRTPDDTPWCTFVSTNAPHDPYIAPKEFFDLYADTDIPKPTSFDDAMRDKPTVYRRIQRVWDQLGWEQFEKATKCYYALCSMVDHEVGRILALLEEQNRLDNTIIVYTSDHGDLMGAHRLFCKGVPAFEESYRIPLKISWKGALPAGKTIDANVSILDLAPTLIDLAGLPPMGIQDGESLVPIIRGEDSGEGRSSYAAFYGQRMSYTQRVVWKDGWKYVFNAFDDDELYDLEADPAEVQNLAAHDDQEKRKKEMAREMWNWAKRTGDETFLESEYFMYRFAPLGPEQDKKASIYNRGA